MLDPRIYRTGLVAVVLAVIVFAFALQGPAAPLSTSLAPDAFNGQNAYQDTVSLARGFPRRSPGSTQDGALGQVIAARLRADGYGVREQHFVAATPWGPRRLFNVIGVQQGLSNAAIVVVAHRDSLHSPAVAEQSGTGVLLELARVFSGETFSHTVVVVSTSGSAGAAGAARIAAGLRRPIDAVIALGDMAGTGLRHPLVVPWSNTSQLAPEVLRSTVGAALRAQAGLSAGSPSLLGELAHLAFPFAVTEQAPFDARGVPAVLLSASSAAPPPAAEPVSLQRVTRLGRAALEAVGALDGRSRIPSPSAYMNVGGKLLPKWVMQLLVLALILPGIATAIDGFARARRRGYLVGRRFVWIGMCTLPFIAVVLITRVLGATGLINAPAEPVGPDTFPLGTGGIAILACLAALIVGSFAWFWRAGGLRALVGRDGMGGAPAKASLHRAVSNGNARQGANGAKRREPLGDPGAVAATLIVLCALALVVWAVNPFAALLLVPALHVWLVALAPGARLGRSLRVVMLGLGFALPALVVAYYVVTLGFGPLGLIWTAAMMVAGGQLGLPAALLLCLLLGVAVSAVANVIEILRAKIDRTQPATPITVRGPVTYAGPGSLGGTKSALSGSTSAPESSAWSPLRR
jgi:hypothetical protein